MMINIKEQIPEAQAALRAVKAAYISIRGRGGLNRTAWETEKEIEETGFLDDVLSDAVALVIKKELARIFDTLPETFSDVA